LFNFIFFGYQTLFNLDLGRIGFYKIDIKRIEFKKIVVAKIDLSFGN